MRALSFPRGRIFFKEKNNNVNAFRIVQSRLFSHVTLDQLPMYLRDGLKKKNVIFSDIVTKGGRGSG